jgi:dihydropyrimidinase
VDDEGILAVLEVARQHGAMVVVHAENYAATNWLTDRLLAEGKGGPQFNARSKTDVVEREAVHRIIALAEIVGVPIQIFHVSSRAALEEIERAQSRGLPVFAETCPQYLMFTESDLAGSDEQAARLVFGPPPRTAADQEALWLAIARNIVGVVSSDHSPHNLRGAYGKLDAAREGGFKATPHGIPGLETRLPILFSEGVVKGRIDITRFVDITSTAPAKIFGLYPRKGSIAIGADADLAVWDPSRKMRITNHLLHHKVDYTPYEGIEVAGMPVTTISRGQVVWANGKFDARAGGGRLLLRDAYSLPSFGKAGTPAAQPLLHERGN